MRNGSAIALTLLMVAILAAAAVQLWQAANL